MNLTVVRFSRTPQGVFGALLDAANHPLCLTLEDPWKGNQSNVSCVPPGIYRCLPHTGQKYQNVWRLENVPGRTGILIHNGNTIQHTEGCILVGKAFGRLDALPSITDSKATLDMLRHTLPAEFQLTIIG